MYMRPPTHEEYDMTRDKPELSVILPGIHPHKWTKVYNSIMGATSRPFELILVTPLGATVPPWFWYSPNIKIVKDYGSPVRAHAIGASLAEGKLITCIPDDGKFVSSGLDAAIDKLYAMGTDHKNIVTYKFTENEKVYTDEYYKINFHKGEDGEGIGSEYISDDYYILNHCVMYRDYYEKLGGIDCSYEGTAIAYIDFSIRAQYDGALVQLLEGIPILNCSQFTEGDHRHSDIEKAQKEHDEPVYKERYKTPNWREKMTTKLSVFNWKESPLLWPRKYKPIIEQSGAKYAYFNIGDKLVKRFFDSPDSLRKFFNINTQLVLGDTDK